MHQQTCHTQDTARTLEPHAVACIRVAPCIPGFSAVSSQIPNEFLCFFARNDAFCRLYFRLPLPLRFHCIVVVPQNRQPNKRQIRSVEKVVSRECLLPFRYAALSDLKRRHLTLCGQLLSHFDPVVWLVGRWQQQCLR